MTPKNIADALVLFYLFVMWGGYELAKAALERRMTLAFIAVLVGLALLFCAPLALVAYVG